MDSIASIEFDWLPTIALGIVVGAICVKLQFYMANKFVTGECKGMLKWASILAIFDLIIAFGVVPFLIFIPISHLGFLNIHAKGTIIVWIFYCISLPVYDRKFYKKDSFDTDE